MKNILFSLISISIILSSSNSFAVAMKLRSPDFQPGKKISETHVFNDFGCTGENKSPALIISNVPSQAKSLAITVYDPDAPTGSGWWHWIAYNIDPSTTQVALGADKISENVVYGKNDYGTYNYGGPCPPKGTTHRYIFSLYALNVDKLDVPSDASAAMIGYNINSHSIAKSEFLGFYTRK